jgi:hypothetical protein
MINATRIDLRDGVVILPAGRAYDDAVALEDATFYARRHGEVVMETQHHRVVVRVVEGVRCTACERRLTLSFGTAERTLCLRCAKALLCGSPGTPVGSDATVRDRRVDGEPRPRDHGQ